MLSESLGGKVDKARLSCLEAENRVLRLALEQLLECAEVTPLERRETEMRVAMLIRRWPAAVATERVVS